MDIGRLNSRIEIWQDVMTENRLGEVQPSKELLKTVWANVEPRTGSLLTGRPADTMLSRTTHRIEVRKESVVGVTSDCTIFWWDSNKVKHRFDIEYILPPGREPTTSIYVYEVI